MKTPTTASFSGPELCKLDATEVVALLRKKEISAEEVLAASLQRIEQVEVDVNCMPTVCEDRARLSLQDLATYERQSGDHPGWLAGLPIGIKDLSKVAGVRTTFGSMGYSDFIPDESEPPVLLLEERGGVIVGKTNTPEFGAGGNTFNEVFGYTRNPWDTRKNAGGSSGGAAVSVATGEVWLSSGSDLAGSLRTPAAYCGVVGLRPSPGRIRGNANGMGFQYEAVLGPMARNVTDCALFLDAMSGFSPMYPISIEAPVQPYSEAVKSPWEKVRVGWAPTLNGFGELETEIREVLEDALKTFERSGATVEEACPDLATLEETYRTLRGVFYAASYASLSEEKKKHFKPTLRENLKFGMELDSKSIFSSCVARTKIFTNVMTFLQRFDVLACPVVGLRAQDVEIEYPNSVNGKPVKNYLDWLNFTFLSTTVGLPSISLPAGFTQDGMPVGIQLIGPNRGEDKLLRVARSMELALGLSSLPIDPKVRHRS